MATMIDQAITRIRQLVEDKKVTLGQVSETTDVPYSTVHEMIQPGWSTRAVDNLRKLEAGLPAIEKLVEEAPVP